MTLLLWTSENLLKTEKGRCLGEALSNDNQLLKLIWIEHSHFKFIQSARLHNDKDKFIKLHQNNRGATSGVEYV